MASVGDINKNGLVLIAATPRRSAQHAFARLWVVAHPACRQVSTIQSCDFHVRLCPHCQGGEAENTEAA